MAQNSAGGAEARARSRDELSGEGESLWGKINPKNFGDRVYRGRPSELDDKVKRSRKKKERDRIDAEPASVFRRSKRRRLCEDSVLSVSVEEEGVNRPTNSETGKAYEEIIEVIQKQLGGQPLSVVGAADEILDVLKNESFEDSEKKKEIQKLWNPIADEVFDRLVSIGGRITDYGAGIDALEDGGEAVDDDVGVAVRFEQDEEEEESSDLDMVMEDEEQDGNNVVIPSKSGAMQIGGEIDDDDVQEADNDGSSLNVQDIGAYWLQRRIFEAYEKNIDPVQCRKLSEEVLQILAEDNDRGVETRLLMHLQFDKFNLVKLLVRNRLKIVWCTRLGRAESEDERKKIEEDMLHSGPDLAAILQQLHNMRASAKERQKNLEKSIREEARRLKDETAGNELGDRDGGSYWFRGEVRLLDLDSLAQEESRFLVSNKCVFPLRSRKEMKKGYEEIHVPALKPQPYPDHELVKVSAMPDWAQPAFKGMSRLNRIQSRVYGAALFEADNILLCAPTGAGKTNVAVLTILHQIGLNMNKENGTINHSDYKIVYVAPMKALVAEVVRNLSNRLQDYGVTVKELSGDQTLTRQQIEETQIIVTTPEKWDIITRKSGDRTYTQLLKLLIIDEIHLLHDNRGPVLESIVARTVRLIETTKDHIRLVGLSATLPNYEDVAKFLRVTKGLFHFENGFRPVPLSQQYIGITIRKPLQRLQLMNDICYEKVISMAGKHQVLIFVHSRRETAKTACAIRDTALDKGTLGRFLKEDSASHEILNVHKDLVKSNDLKGLLPYGFAIHHAGLNRDDRQQVEALFADGYVQVLVSTATLAWGVNLPAHTVIIKGIQIYNPEKGAWTELSPLDIMQMLGRAGRPQYDSEGEGIIITGHNESQYYLSLMNQQLPIESQLVSKLADQLNAEIVLGTVQNARELVNTHLPDEKMELAQLLDRVPVPVNGSREEPSAKINVLLQAYISQLKLEGLSLSSDMVFITQSGGRLLRAIFEIVLRRGWAQLAGKALKLCKMVDKRDVGRPNTPSPVQWELGELIRMPKMGRMLHKFIHQFPKLNLAAHVQPITRTVLNVELVITPDFQWEDRIHGYVEPFWVIVEDNDGECILHHEYFLLKKLYIDEDHTLNFTVPIYEPLPPQYYIRVVSDRWLGSETALPVSFRHLILPDKYPPPTELLDLQPFPLAARRNPVFEALYDHDFKHFNLIQTQVFTVLYNSDENVLVAAPTGSGKTICAEFAILRNHQKGTEADSPVMRVVYIAPFEALANERYSDWERKFGKGLNLCVEKLSGEINTDLKRLEKSHIIISTPEKWDALSRRRKEWKHVQQVSLFIVDELHLISGQCGPILEAIVSRMRYISTQSENMIRIVALSTSLGNAKDLGEWIGATSHSIFNFPPAARPVPLEIHIQGVDFADFEARMQAMMKLTYTAIVQHARNGEPALVYVPTRKHVRLTAEHLVTCSNVNNETPPFLLRSWEGHIESLIGSLNDERLQSTLRIGVGYLHEGLTSSDQQIVSQLYESGWIQVRVVSSSMCWGVPLSAHLVVVMGTQYYDCRENVHTDYHVTDLLQMMGGANRPLLDDSGKCFILCHTPRKEYYKKFLYEALPVESHFHHYLHDNVNAKIVAGMIENKQDAVDYLTWTFLYRRITQNPNYYNLQVVSQRHLSEHFSELVETTLSDLEASECVAIKNEKNLSPLPLGMIASYYYISYTTVERFSSSLTSKTKMKGLLEILAQASEYSQLPIRSGDEELVRRLINHQRFSFENPKCTDPHVKANTMLQAHFSRQPVGGNLTMDQQEVILSATRLVYAMIDVISSNGWLRLAVQAMELSQMVIQGMWDRDSELLQLPHFTKELAKRCQDNPEKSVETVFDLKEMKDDERRKLLEMSDAQLLDVQRFCNWFPDIDVKYEVLGCESINAGEEKIILQVSLNRELDGWTEAGPVDAPRYPKGKEEGWWLVVGDTMTDSLLDIKKVSVQKKSKIRLEFAASAAETAGKKTYTLYFMCDSYMGCDQEISVDIN
ncbi:hypothetical protein ACFX12_045349 [Malus domestica]